MATNSGLPPPVGAEAGVHAAGLELAAGGDRGDFAVFVLPRQPGLKVMGFLRAKAHVAGAKHDGAVGDAQFFKDGLGATGHAFVFGQARFRGCRSSPSRPFRTGAGAACRRCPCPQSLLRSGSIGCGRSCGSAGRLRPAVSPATELVSVTSDVGISHQPLVV